MLFAFELTHADFFVVFFLSNRSSSPLATPPGGCFAKIPRLTAPKAGGDGVWRGLGNISIFLPGNSSLRILFADVFLRVFTHFESVFAFSASKKRLFRRLFHRVLGPNTAKIAVFTPSKIVEFSCVRSLKCLFLRINKKYSSPFLSPLPAFPHVPHEKSLLPCRKLMRVRASLRSPQSNLKQFALRNSFSPSSP